MAKSKFKEINCPSCKKVTKMVILKEPEENKGWFECTRCHHSFCIDLNTINEEKKESKEIPEKENCIEYSPLKEYSPGDGIFHAEWDDVGLVESKEIISNGNSVIVVRFKNSGVKKLVENLKIEEESTEIIMSETTSIPTESLDSNIDQDIVNEDSEQENIENGQESTNIEET